jgi:hypothetical protein
VREEIRKAFPDAQMFLFEHLKEGYFRVSIDNDDKHAYLVTDSNNDVKTIIAKLNESMNKPYNFLDDLNDASEIQLKEPEHQDLDPKIVLENFKSFDALWTPEEKEESDREIRHTRANRVWLLGNKRSFVNTLQTKKFHELANEARNSSPEDLELAILKSYFEAIKE